MSEQLPESGNLQDEEVPPVKVEATSASTEPETALQEAEVVIGESFSESHPDANTPGFLLDVPDVSAKKFIFRSRSKIRPEVEEYDVITVIVPERMQASYGLYVWPSAPVLAWYLYEHRHRLFEKRILELGAGTALPGVVAAMCGARVTLSDSLKLPHCLEQCRITAEINGVADKVQIIGLTWGLFLNNVTKLKGNVDLIIGSDCFYDPVVFEDLISTVAYILENNQNAKFLTTYQERSSDWSIQHLLMKWKLKCKHVPLKNLANECRVDLLAMMQNHTIHLLEITLQNENSEDT